MQVAYSQSSGDAEKNTSLQGNYIRKTVQRASLPDAFYCKTQKKLASLVLLPLNFSVTFLTKLKLWFSSWSHLALSADLLKSTDAWAPHSEYMILLVSGGDWV